MMIDILKPSIFPDNIIAGVATGYISDFKKISYFETSFFDSQSTKLSRKLLESSYENEITRFYYQKQIHSDIIIVINSGNIDLKAESDAIISNTPGILFNVSVADCQAILMYDSVNKVIAAVHSGWKVTNLNIVGNTISKMKDTYDTKTKDLLVYLSPSACVDNYEVGKEFTSIFPDTTIRIKGKYFFDNRKEILKQLLESGVLKNNIESNKECTITNNRYHSYRRDKNTSGRMSAFIGIRAPL